MWGIYNPHKILPVGRLKGRPTVKFLTVEPVSRPPGRSRPEPESNGSLAGRPPGRPEQPESGLLSVGRPAQRLAACTFLVHVRSTGTVDRRARSQPFGPVDRLKATHSRVAPVDQAVNRPESRCSLVQGPVDWAVDRQSLTVKFRPLAGRPGGQPDGQL